MSWSIFSAASAFSSLTRVVNAAYSMVEATKPSILKKGAMFLDPGDVVTGLAILAIYRKSGEEGIKISLVDNRILRDHAVYSKSLQAVKRSLYGTTNGQLSDLAVSLFYAAKWFKPKDNIKIKALFSLAREGILALIETYKKEEKAHISQYLCTSHLRIIDLALKGEALVNGEFEIPFWESKPLARYSFKIWSKNNFEKLGDINDLFVSALSVDLSTIKEDYSIGPMIDLVKARVDEAVFPVLSYKESLTSSLVENEIEDDAVEAASSFHEDDSSRIKK